VQTPTLPGIAQELHGLAQAVAQQTPCAQKPLAHSAFTTQGGSPPGRRHVPFRQLPARQSGSAVHVVAQRVPLASHLNGKQESAWGEMHVPAPSQTAVGE
jgi:hypothetical protein